MSRFPEPDLAALRAEIVEAGEATRDLRRVACLYFGLPVALPVFFLALLAGDLGCFAAGVAAAGLFGGSIALPWAWIYRARCRAEIRRVVARLPAERRLEVVMPLQRSRCGDARRIAAGICRELRCTTEVVPAAAPTVRGAEVAVAEEPS